MVEQCSNAGRCRPGHRPRHEPAAGVWVCPLAAEKGASLRPSTAPPQHNARPSRPLSGTGDSAVRPAERSKSPPPRRGGAGRRAGAISRPMCRAKTALVACANELGVAVQIRYRRNGLKFGRWRALETFRSILRSERQALPRRKIWSPGGHVAGLPRVAPRRSQAPHGRNPSVDMGCTGAVVRAAGSRQMSMTTTPTPPCRRRRSWLLGADKSLRPGERATPWVDRGRATGRVT